MGGLARCAACGEVQWNLRRLASTTQRCRVCNEELRPERRRPGRQLTGVLKHERRDAHRATPA